MSTPLTYLKNHEGRFLEELLDFLRIPSVSPLSAHKEDVARAAAFLEEKLKKAGADKVYLIPTEGNPLVYAEKIIDPKRPTILVYGHYDVQPAEPLDLWETPPFSPEIRNGRMYARGASDDKGQLYMHVKALEIMQATGTLACNIKFIIEGEEEIGSPQIQQFLQHQANRQLLQSDVILVSDNPMLSLETPSLDIGLRGAAAFQVTVEGPNRDLHSGAYGGAVANTAEMLCRILAQMKDAEGRVLIPGFYDEVAELSPKERQELNSHFDDEAYKKSIGLDELFGEKGYTTKERASIRPTFEINGIQSGYTGEGIKTILPAKALAKITIRTVPYQDTKKLSKAIRQHIASLAPTGVRVHVEQIFGDGYDAFLSDKNNKGVQVACKAYEKVLGKRPLLLRRGGTIPILTQFQKFIQPDVVNFGFGLDSDAIHSPNESFHVENFLKGIQTIIAFYEEFFAHS